MCLRECEQQKPSHTLIVSNYPDHFKEDDLKMLIGNDLIKCVKFNNKKAEVTFKSQKFAQRALILDSLDVQGKKLSVMSFD